MSSSSSISGTSTQQDISWYTSRRTRNPSPYLYDVCCLITAYHASAGSQNFVLRRLFELDLEHDDRKMLEVVLGMTDDRATGPYFDYASVPTRFWYDRDRFFKMYDELSVPAQCTTIRRIRQVVEWSTNGSIVIDLPQWLRTWWNTHCVQLMDGRLPLTGPDQPRPIRPDPEINRLHALRQRLRNALDTIKTPGASGLVKARFRRVLAEDIQSSSTDFLSSIWRGPSPNNIPSPFIVLRSTERRRTGAIQLLGFRSPDTQDMRELCGMVHDKVNVASMNSSNPLTYTPSTFAASFEGSSSASMSGGLKPNPRAMLEWECTRHPPGSSINPPDFVVRHDWFSRYEIGTNLLKFLQVTEADFCTSWHIDLAGSSQYFYVSRGVKHLFFVEPTQANLDRLYGGHDDETEGDLFLGYTQVQFVRLTVGETIVVPSGWIHAVYTPVDSVVISGNFLNDLNLPLPISRRIITTDPSNGILYQLVQCCVLAAEEYHRRMSLLNSVQRLPAIHSIPPHSHVTMLADFLHSCLTEPTPGAYLAFPRARKRAKDALENLKSDLLQRDRFTD